MCIRDRAQLFDRVGELDRPYAELSAAERFDLLSAELGRRCLLYTSDAADERSSVDLGGRRIIKKKQTGVM